MKPSEKVDRREFTVQSALALLSGVTITIWGCGDGDDSPAPTSMTPMPAPQPEPTSGVSDVMGVVGSNHGHVAVIEGARLAEGDALELDITGNADHPHAVSLTADEVQRIAAGTRVSRMSTTNLAHAHTVTFN